MNEEEFKATVMPGCRTLYVWASRIVGAEEASDIVQESLRRLWERRHELAAMENVSSYMMITARNLMNDILRGKQNLVGLRSIANGEVEDDSVPEMEQTEEKKLLRRMLGMLPDNQRTVVRLSLMAEMSNSQIAEATGLSYEAVRQNLSRGRKKLRELYKAATK